jgi:uncharacterized protein YdhG (YjbR/CyaY superfamily)
MKKTKASKRSGVAIGKRAAESVDEYFAGVAGAARGTLREMRAAIRAAAPAEATETISYRMPAFRYKGVLVWYAAFSGHCSLFPTAAVIEAFRKELKGFSTSKGTIQFPTGKPLPMALIKRMVRARVEKVEGKKGR